MDDSTEGSSCGIAGRWRKSPYSTSGECVELGQIDTKTGALRNSNSPDRGTVFSSRAGLAGWIAGCKAGEFDDLTAV